MSVFCVPTPCIIPLRLPVFGESKIVNADTKIEILCETELPDIEIFYTIDGTKPNPYIPIVQGSKTYKYSHPFTLPVGKITIKAMAIHSLLHTMCSNVITKTFHVFDVEKKTKRVRSSIITKKEEQTRKSELSTAESSYSKELKVESPVDNGLDINDADSNYSEVTLGVFLVDRDDCLSEKHELVDEENSSCESDNCPSLEIEETAAIEESGVEFPASIQKDSAIQTDQDSEKLNETNQSQDVLPPQPFAQFEMPLQHCMFCNKVNSLCSKFCDECGKKLCKLCSKCQEQNPSVANFCQFCGQKFSSSNGFAEETFETKDVPKKQKSFGMLFKPFTVNKSIDVTCPVSTQSSQTSFLPLKDSKKAPTRKVTSLSPGRGYWRQQIDYICNHLKAHANNNLEFQKQIGEPQLGRFLSADVVFDEASVFIRIEFESLTSKKKNSS